MSRAKQITPVMSALEHVRKHFPKVCAVVYLPDSTWRFMDEEGFCPMFDDKIDVSILENAQNWVDNTHGFPAAFTI